MKILEKLKGLICLLSLVKVWKKKLEQPDKKTRISEFFPLAEIEKVKLRLGFGFIISKYQLQNSKKEDYVVILERNNGSVHSLAQQISLKDFIDESIPLTRSKEIKNQIPIINASFQMGKREMGNEDELDDY